MVPLHPLLSRVSGIRLVVVWALVVASTVPAFAGTNRFWLAAQHDWGVRRGFYLNFENSSEGAARCRLETLSLILGVADGKEWRYLSRQMPWQYDREYVVRGVISPAGAQLWLDGELLAESAGAFVPYEGPITANHVPGWAGDPAEYLCVQSSLSIRNGSRERKEVFPGAGRPLALILFEPQGVRNIPWRTDPTQGLVLEAAFRLVRYPDLRELSPFVDRYGQCRYADWPGKVRTDADLHAARRLEEARLKAWGVPAGYDRYGGWKGAGWRLAGTGFYRVVRRQGFWWLVSPEGNPCFYLSVCSAPGLTWETTPVSDREYLYEWLPTREGDVGAAWSRNQWGIADGTEYVAFHTVNLVRKFGRDWSRKAEENARQRMRAWGFSGIGKWGGTAGMAFLPVLGRWDVPNLARHPDVFDPQVCARLRESLRRQIEPRRNDPFVVGWSLGNEYDEIVTRGEVADILQRGAGVPAKRALVDHALQRIYGGSVARLAEAWKVTATSVSDLYAAAPQPPSGDVEALRRFYADRYYATVYQMVRGLDPNHLYLGFWIVPGWWEDEEDWRIAARHCDVIGYDRYAPTFLDERLARLLREAGKPALCGEFSFPSWYDGTRGFGLYGTWARDDAEAGELYQRWVTDAARNPYCIGLAWFQYRDQPLTGRGPGRGERLVHGEHFAFGVVDITDRPKWDLVLRMRQVNLKAARMRQEASRKAGGK